MTKHPIKLEAAARTDRGVHAIGQVVSTSVDTIPSLYNLNALLPPDIKVFSITDVPEHFHPSLDAKQKEYEYIVHTGHTHSPFTKDYAWHYRGPFDLFVMQMAAKKLIGTHDFSAFANAGAHKETIRTIYDITIREENNRLIFSILGKSFLYKMVRNIVGTLLYIGNSKLLSSDIKAILLDKNRKNAGITAPAHGLFLKRVYY